MGRCISSTSLLRFKILELHSTGKYFATRWTPWTRAGFESLDFWGLNQQRSKNCKKCLFQYVTCSILHDPLTHSPPSAQGAPLRENTPEEKELARVYRRFYLALQLRDLCNEMPIHMVARKYDSPRGSVQTLAQTCQGFAAGIIKFCEHMGWG